MFCKPMVLTANWKKSPADQPLVAPNPNCEPLPGKGEKGPPVASKAEAVPAPTSAETFVNHSPGLVNPPGILVSRVQFAMVLALRDGRTPNNKQHNESSRINDFIVDS